MERIDRNGNPSNWQESNIHVFWGEIAPSDHLVQMYENDEIFLNTLEGFTGDGFLKGESVVVIATADHLKALEFRLRVQCFDIANLIAKHQYLPLDVDESLAKFMVDGWPDEDLFIQFVSDIMAQAQKGNKEVRAFGEMVAVLWAQGHSGATVKLENLWHRLQQKKGFCLYCAYPKSGFTQDTTASFDHICQSHSKIIDGNTRASTEIYYCSVA